MVLTQPLKSLTVPNFKGNRGKTYLLYRYNLLGYNCKAILGRDRLSTLKIPGSLLQGASIVVATPRRFMVSIEVWVCGQQVFHPGVKLWILKECV